MGYMRNNRSKRPARPGFKPGHRSDKKPENRGENRIDNRTENRSESRGKRFGRPGKQEKFTKPGKPDFKPRGPRPPRDTGPRIDDRPNLYGTHAVRAAWLNPARRIKTLYLTDAAARGFEDAIAEAKKRKINRPEPMRIEKDALEKILPRGAVHQGIAVNAAPPEETTLTDIIIRARDAQNALVLVLDQITDPHNVGAILRSASAFGAAGVVMQRRHAPALDGVLAKTACGAVDHVHVALETNLSRALEELREGGFFIIGLDERGGQSIADIKPGGKVAAVLGSEGEGIRRLVTEHCDAMVRLPTGGPIASLNVSNAAAVVLFALSGR